MANNTSTRAAAAAALATYREQEGHTGGNDRENITDLVTDLLHLADELHVQAVAEGDDDSATGETIIDAVGEHYFEEREQIEG